MVEATEVARSNKNNALSQDFDESILEYTVSCSIVFEERIAELYEYISTRLPFPIAEVLLHMARESRNHAVFFRSLSKMLSINASGCKRNKVISYIEELLGKVKNRELTLNDIEEILSECVDLEKNISEEYNVKILSNLIKAHLKPSSFRNIGGLKIILEEISVEENYHSSLLEYVLESIEAMLY